MESDKFIFNFLIWISLKVKRENILDIHSRNARASCAICSKLNFLRYLYIFTMTSLDIYLIYFVIHQFSHIGIVVALIIILSCSNSIFCRTMLTLQKQTMFPNKILMQQLLFHFFIAVNCFAGYSANSEAYCTKTTLIY